MGELLVLIIVVIVCSVLALAIYQNNSRSVTNKAFIVAGLAIVLWSLGIYISLHAPSPQSTLFFIRLSMLTGTLFATSFFVLAIVFPSVKFPIKKSWLIPIFFLALLTMAVAMSPYMFTSLRVTGKNIEPIPGPGILLFVVTALGYNIATFVILIAKYRHSRGREKNQLLSVVLGTILMFFLLITTNFIAVTVFKTSQLIYLGPLFTLTFLGSIAYAILRHRLFDIRLLVVRSIVYALLVFSIGVIYVIGFLFLHPFTQNGQAISIFLILVLVFSFQPLRSFLEKITDSIFYKEKYDQQRLLYDLALLMASTLRLGDLTKKLLGKIRHEMRISYGAFIFIEKQGAFTITHDGYEHEPIFRDEEVTTLLEQQSVTVLEELSEGDVKELLRRLNINILIPLRVQGESIGVLVLGEKRSGDMYATRDVRLLEIFAPEASIAIQNAQGVERLIKLDEVKSEFITVVSHQLRTPLSVSRWNFELLFEGTYGKLSAPIEEVLRHTYNALISLNQTLNDLMIALEIEEEKSVLHIEENEFEKDILDQVLLIFKSEVEQKHLKIIKNIVIPSPIFGDRHKLMKIFEVLLDNAIRYSPAKSSITISGKVIEKNGREEHIFSITDRGIGVEPKNRELIFQRFFRGEEAKHIVPDGLGLGLFIAKAYVKLHGGGLWIEEQPLPGSTFSFSIPSVTVIGGRE